MAAYPILVLEPTALFRFRTHWPRWKRAIVSVSLARSFTDGTYNNNGGTDLQGGSFVESGGGSVEQGRWDAVERDGEVIGSASWEQQEGQFSARPGEGGLYTAAGRFAFAEEIETGLANPITVVASLAWDITPLLDYPGSPPGGSVDMRGRPDGRLMLMQVPVAGLGPFYGWDAFTGTIEGTFSSQAVNNTGFDPIEFNLEELTETAFGWNKTLSITTTFSPPDDDPDIGYYPTRGSTTLTGSVTASLTFVE